MLDIYIFLFAVLIIWHFAYQRKQAEVARLKATKYCEEQGLQFMAIARHKNQLKFSKRLGLYWRSYFFFDFSGDGESSYQGEVVMDGNKVKEFNLPAYKV